MYINQICEAANHCIIVNLLCMPWSNFHKLFECVIFHRVKSRFENEVKPLTSMCLQTVASGRKSVTNDKTRKQHLCCGQQTYLSIRYSQFLVGFNFDRIFFFFSFFFAICFSFSFLIRKHGSHFFFLFG